MSNLTELEKVDKTKFVHFPKKVHKLMLRNCVRDCIVAEHLSVLSDNLLFTSFETAVWLLGVNSFCANPQITKEFVNVLNKYKLSKIDTMNEVVLQNTAKLIIKEWKEIISIFNLKNETYAH